MDPSSSWAAIVRGVVVPVALAYLGILLALVANHRDPRHGRMPPGGRPQPASWRQLVLHMCSIVVVGYLTFLVIIVAFSFELGGQPPSFVGQAFGYGSALAFGLVLPGFLALSATERFVARRRRHRS